MKYEVGKWYPWTGGECPVHPYTKVVCKFDDGAENCEPEAAGTWIWLGCGIVAFKVVEEYEEPMEFWIVVEDGVPRDIAFLNEADAKHYIDVFYGDRYIKVREVKE